MQVSHVAVNPPPSPLPLGSLVAVNPPPPPPLYPGFCRRGRREEVLAETEPVPHVPVQGLMGS